MSRRRDLVATLVLLAAPVIWGVSFPAWKAIYRDLDVPDTLFWVRVTGLAALLPVILLRPASRAALRPALVRPGILLGLLLTAPTILQSIGLARTTASAAAFITTIYVVLTPLVVAVARRARPVGGDLGVAAIALAGVAVLSLDGGVPAPGDVIVAISALGWAVHIVVLGRLAPRHDPFALTFAMVAVSSAIHLALALPGGLDPAGARAAFWPILIAGPGATALAYGLQIAAQRRVPPSRTAVILAGESLFAALSGALWLDERLSARQWLGALVVLGAMAVSEARGLRAASRTIPA